MARSLKHPLRQVAVATNADAEDAVFATLERILGVTPGIHTDVQTGAVTVSTFCPIPDPKVAPLRAELRAALAGLVECGAWSFMAAWKCGFDLKSE